jgi:hypothetical protein
MTNILKNDWVRRLISAGVFYVAVFSLIAVFESLKTTNYSVAILITNHPALTITIIVMSALLVSGLVLSPRDRMIILTGIWTELLLPLLKLFSRIMGIALVIALIALVVWLLWLFIRFIRLLWETPTPTPW